MARAKANRKRTREEFDGVANDLMTWTCAAMGAVFLYVCAQKEGMVMEFAKYVAGCLVVVWICGFIARPIARARGLNRTNANKTHEQIWQTVAHVSMTWLNWGCWAAFVGNEAAMFTPAPIALDATIETVYVVQTAVWLVTAARHRFVAERAKDYYLMYAHHAVTLLLVVGSYVNGDKRIGALVLLLHDSSDILVDCLRLGHDLGLDADAGIYFAEVSFVGNLFTWAYVRLYRFPVGILASIVAQPSAFLNATGHQVLNGLLCVLYCMHCYWYYLFGRILYKLLAGVKSHEAGRDYEGDSESEDEGGDDKKTKSS